MTTTSPDHDVRLGDVYDFEGVPRSPRRHCDVVAIPAMELGLTGIAQLRSALDEGEAGILGCRPEREGGATDAEPDAEEDARIAALARLLRAQIGDAEEIIGKADVTQRELGNLHYEMSEDGAGGEVAVKLTEAGIALRTALRVTGEFLKPIENAELHAELDRLRARNAELERQLAESGASRG